MNRKLLSQSPQLWLEVYELADRLECKQLAQYANEWGTVYLLRRVNDMRLKEDERIIGSLSKLLKWHRLVRPGFLSFLVSDTYKSPGHSMVSFTIFPFMYHPISPILVCALSGFVMSN